MLAGIGKRAGHYGFISAIVELAAGLIIKVNPQIEIFPSYISPESTSNRGHGRSGIPVGTFLDVFGILNTIDFNKLLRFKFKLLLIGPEQIKACFGIHPVPIA